MRTSWIGAAGLMVAGAAACGSPVDGLRSGPPGGEAISYSARTVLLESYPVQIRTWVDVRNDASTPQTVEFPDGCVVVIRAYRDAARTGAPAWDQFRRVGCRMAIVPVTVQPGETEQIGAPTVSARDVLGDSVPDGRYWLSAVIRPGGERLELPAGQADLAVPR